MNAQPTASRVRLPAKARWALLFYNLVFPFVFLAMLPGFALRMMRRGRYRHKFGQRFGSYSERVRGRLKGRRPVWVHAVSVGEVLIGLKLLKKMRALDPALTAVLSTTTSTGFALAHDKAGDWIEVIYHPLDFSPIVRRAFKTIQPCMLVLVEAEVWPNLVARAKKCGIPVALVNARLSPRSERRFRQARTLVGPVFRLLDLICVQEPGDVARWQSLGMDEKRVEHTGSIKFDQADEAPSRTGEFRGFLRHLGVKDDAPVLLAGSTFRGEESIIAKIFCELRAEFPALFLIIVPRHVERTPNILVGLQPLGLHIVLRSNPAATSGVTADCLLVNTTGELREWYQLADVVFVGKSLTGQGGQNPVEAVVAGKPVLFGPHMQNFAAVAHLLLAHHAATQVAGIAELRTETARLLRDPSLRAQTADRARQAVAAHQGATARTVARLQRFST